MAAEANSIPVNGNFMPGQPASYGMDHGATSQSAGSSATATADFTAASSSAPHQHPGGSNTEIPKDEVGWYFVEQYYTTLSRHPEKLYLFYNKRSQYVSGDETEKVTVCVGQKAINERIKAFGFQDCKVRVTNVDSQGSGQNIVIQVIGEMSNRSSPQRRFTQTFVLAEQTNGYFVLNDIFRSLLEDDEEEVAGGESAPQSQPEAAVENHEDESAATNVTEPFTLSNADDPEQRESKVAAVDQGIKDAIEDGPQKAADPAAALPSSSSTTIDQVAHAEDAPAAAAPPVESTADAVETVGKDVVTQTEVPEEPEPTPVASPPKQAPVQPTSSAAVSKPAAPKTWANLVAGGNRAAAVAAAAAAAPASSTGSASSNPTAPNVQGKSPAAPAQPQVAPASASPAPEPEQPTTPQSSGSEWQTAHTRHDHGKKQARVQPQSIPGGPDNSRAYIKNVGENIDVASLRAILTKYGELTYIDINRQKNCAFADFATPTAYQAAVAANPHELQGERLNVEERRVRPQSFGGGFPRGGPIRGGRGGAPSAANQGRGGFQKDGARGGLPNRGRGNGSSRGRNVQQAV